MLTLIDSGCGKHPRKQLTLTGYLACLVGGLITNLPLQGACPTYICEYGHTHYLLLQYHEDDVRDDLKPGPSSRRLAGGRKAPVSPE